MNKFKTLYFSKSNHSNFKKIALFFIFAIFSSPIFAQYTGTGTFTKITDVSEIVDDAYYILLDETSESFAMSNVLSSSKFLPTGVSPSSSTLTDPDPSIVWEIKTDGAYKTIYNPVTEKYVSYTGSSNNIQAVNSVSSNNQKWSFSFVVDEFQISNAAITNRRIQYNSGAPRFVCYTGSQRDIALYKMPIVTSSEPIITFETANSEVTETDTNFTTTIPVNLTNYNSDITIGISVNTESTAQAGDYTLNTESITFTEDGQQNISIEINDDTDGDNEILILDLFLISGTADFLTFQHTLNILDDDLPNILISEISYNSGDSYGSDDEWIEIYNADVSAVDVSGWTIENTSNAFNNPYTFPPSTSINSGAYILIAIGSNGDGTFNNANPFTPDFNHLGVDNTQVASTNDTNHLVNSSSTFTLQNTGGSDIDIVTYDDEDAGGIGSGTSHDGGGKTLEIQDTTADNSTTASNWQASVFNGGTPGFVETSWIGTASSDWADVTNWSTGALPTNSDIVIVDGTFTNEPAITSTDAAVNSLFVASGNTLAIDETSSLTVSGDFTNNGTVTLNSTADDYSSLIVTGTATGDIVYNRYVNVYDDTLGGGWDLVCSPVGMSIADFITANGSNIQVLDDDYAFSQFNNATGQWERYATAEQTGNFEAGKGYSMATTGGSTVAFTGAMQTADQSINIINNNGLNGVGRRWNLVSNPFPSYILGNTAAGTNNFMDANSAVIDSEFLAVYGWNGSSYTIYNNLSGAFSMAPGQGFWVAALNTTDTALNFTAAMRTTTGTGDFVSGPQLLTYNVAVKLYNGEIEKAATDFYFRDGLSLDLDPGYDAAAFNQSMALSTRLPQGSQETAFGINAMGMDAMQNTRVPLEIRQNAGQAFRVSIADMELPEDIYVYLEDTLNGTLTSLKDGDFELVAQSNLSGSDRFFIVFKSNSVLSNGDTLGINALNVYKTNTDSFVTIAGISPELGKLNVSLYNILGQTVREKALSSATATQTISTDGLASGLYIVQIRSGNQTTVKKIIVK
jgi:hypothetical protein